MASEKHVWNEPYNNQDIYNITETKRILNLNRRYRPGTGDMLVFLNGMLTRRYVDYIEINPWTLQFTDDLIPGDVVACQLQKLW